MSIKQQSHCKNKEKTEAILFRLNINFFANSEKSLPAHFQFAQMDWARAALLFFSIKNSAFRPFKKLEPLFFPDKRKPNRAAFFLLVGKNMKSEFSALRNWR